MGGRGENAKSVQPLKLPHPHTPASPYSHAPNLPHSHPRKWGKNVVLIGTLDTKGPEFAYVRDRLRELGLETTVVDTGILGEPLGIEPDVDHAEVARHGGTTIEALQNAGSRGEGRRWDAGGR